MEQKEDGTLLFINMLLRRREDGSWDISVYRKPMHTDRHLDFKSHHLTHMKRGVVRCQRTSAHRTTFRRKLTTLLESSSRTVNFKLYASAPPTQEQQT